MKGFVIRNTGSWYQVKTGDGRSINTKLKGSFRLKEIQSTNPVVVGDSVFIEENLEGTAFICEIEERKNYLVRRSSNLSKQSHIIAANVDQISLIVTIKYPITTTLFIDRFLTATEAHGIPVSLFFNKTDRYNKDDCKNLDEIMNLYRNVGYSCYKLSAFEDKNLAFMHELFRDRITLFSGHSGVGKSTIINRLVPGREQKVQALSEYHNKGIHTTSFSEMISLPEGGYIIDTPGIKGFGIFDINKLEIPHYFPEIFHFSHNCRFNNCTHRKEPGCAVQHAVINHYICESRYLNYLNILEDKNENKYRAAF